MTETNNHQNREQLHSDAPDLHIAVNGTAGYIRRISKDELPPVPGVQTQKIAEKNVAHPSVQNETFLLPRDFSPEASLVDKRNHLKARAKAITNAGIRSVLNIKDQNNPAIYTPRNYDGALHIESKWLPLKEGWSFRVKDTAINDEAAHPFDLATEDKTGSSNALTIQVAPMMTSGMDGAGRPNQIEDMGKAISISLSSHRMADGEQSMSIHGFDAGSGLTFSNGPSAMLSEIAEAQKMTSLRNYLNFSEDAVVQLGAVAAQPNV